MKKTFFRDTFNVYFSYKDHFKKCKKKSFLYSKIISIVALLTGNPQKNLPDIPKS